MSSASKRVRPGAASDVILDRYVRLLEAGAARVEERLAAEPDADLASLEAGSAGSSATQAVWPHFPHAILAPAALFAKRHRTNPHHGSPRMLALATTIGDLLATEDEAGRYEPEPPRQDTDWDTYMWLEAYRLLEPVLGTERRKRWGACIVRNVALYEQEAAMRVDFPWYNSPFINTSPNHYALWAVNLLLAGQVFENREWERLGTHILRRFATEEQTVDGFWGEHSQAGPTTGYNFLTTSAIGMYWALTRDKAALPALRRATAFHINFTYPNGEPVEVVNDRNRYWEVSTWGHAAFSISPQGRRFAQFLTEFLEPDSMSLQSLGRLAQGFVHFREGSLAPIPQDSATHAYRMSLPAGIRTTGPWVVALSGLIATQAINRRYYFDRQGHVSVFHRDHGLIITGANSKRQPELATFSERLGDQVVHMPLSSRLQMGPSVDRLSLAYNTFFADLFVSEPTEEELAFRFVTTGRDEPADEARLTLQLCLKAGRTLEMGSGQSVLIGADRLQLDGAMLGGRIAHCGWQIDIDPAARLVWPVFPHNPYRDEPETSLEYAVAALSVPLRQTRSSDQLIRPGEQEIRFVLRTRRGLA